MLIKNANWPKSTILDMIEVETCIFVAYFFWLQSVWCAIVPLILQSLDYIQPTNKQISLFFLGHFSKKKEERALH